MEIQFRSHPVIGTICLMDIKASDEMTKDAVVKILVPQIFNRFGNVVIASENYGNSKTYVPYSEILVFPANEKEFKSVEKILLTAWDHIRFIKYDNSPLSKLLQS